MSSSPTERSSVLEQPPPSLSSSIGWPIGGSGSEPSSASGVSTT
jgi:hypothetical protein